MIEIDMTTVYYDCQECGAIAGYDPPQCWNCGSDRAVLRPLDMAIYSTHRFRHRKIDEIEKQRDELLAACEAMCNSIMASGKEACRTRYGSPSYEYISKHWSGFVLDGCLKAWKRGNAAIAAAKGEKE